MRRCFHQLIDQFKEGEKERSKAPEGSVEEITRTWTMQAKGENMNIGCMTCGKLFRNEWDVINCFKAEHQLPDPRNLPDRLPRDNEKAEMLVAILMCHMVRCGKLRYLGGICLGPLNGFKVDPQSVAIYDHGHEVAG